MCKLLEDSPWPPVVMTLLLIKNIIIIISNLVLPFGSVQGFCVGEILQGGNSACVLLGHASNLFSTRFLIWRVVSWLGFALVIQITHEKCN